MEATQKNLKRERETIEAMITLFCREQHRSRGALCEGCAALATYAEIDATFGGTRGQLLVVSTGADARTRADAVAEAADLLQARGSIVASAS